MKYIAAILILWTVMYTISFAKYSLSKKNKMAAAGAILLALLAAVLPIIVMLSR